MNETEYFKLSLRERLQARAPSCCGWFYKGTDPRFQRWQMIFRAPYKEATPSHANRIFYLEAGHGLRIEPAETYVKHSRCYSSTWYVNEWNETTAAHIIRLPKQRGFLLAASDPWNPDAYTVENDAPMPSTTNKGADGYDQDDDAEAAARAACGFAELLSEDYRDDAEHQTALHEYEEQLHPLEKAKEEAEARRDEAEQERAHARAELAQIREDLAQPGLTDQERQILTTEEEREGNRAAECLAEMEGAQDDANDLQDQIDNLEEPPAPNFYYFGKAKR